MSKYDVKYMKSCRKLLDDLEIHNPKLHKKITMMVDEILENPFKSKFKKLKDSKRNRRNSNGDYRVVYFVDDGTVFVSKIGLRKYVYKRNPGCPKLSKKKLKSMY